MFNRTTVYASILSAFTVAAPAFAEDLSASTVVATVNGTDITLGHMIMVRQRLPDEYARLPNATLYKGIMDQLVQQTLLADSFEGELPAFIDLALENDKRTMVAGEAMSQIRDTQVTDADIQAAYDASFSDIGDTEYNASHILVETEDEAKAIIAELEDGADFAEVAQAKSTGPSGPNGGSLGWFGAGMMVQPFEEAVMSLEAGALSAPVQTQFGWHVIKLNDKRVQEAPELEEVRGDLVEQITAVKIEETIQSLTSSAEITQMEQSEDLFGALSNVDLLRE